MDDFYKAGVRQAIEEKKKDLKKTGDGIYEHQKAIKNLEESTSDYAKSCFLHMDLADKDKEKAFKLNLELQSIILLNCPILEELAFAELKTLQENTLGKKDSLGNLVPGNIDLAIQANKVSKSCEAGAIHLRTKLQELVELREKDEKELTELYDLLNKE